jgi:DNA polymerase
LARVRATGSAADFLPERLSLSALREAAAGCKGCHLWQHFKWQARGKRRIHQKPNWTEMTACRPWLEAELAVVKPRVLVLLGATAAQSLLGRQFRVTQHRGELVESDLAEAVTATVHPSSILRGEPEEREANFAAFVDDLRVVARLL